MNSFKFKQFEIIQEVSSMKVNTDGILLGSWAHADNPKTILDIGSGTGLISLMMAQRFPEAVVMGVEIDGPTNEESILNARNSAFSDRVVFINSAIQEFESENKFDLIVSNPPFFSGGTFSFNQDRAQVRHTIKLAHNHLLNAVMRLLAKDGYFNVILPFIEGLRFEQLAERSQLFVRRKTFIRPKPEKGFNRLLLSFSREEGDRIEESMTMYDEENKYSQRFIDLTKDFYLDLTSKTKKP